MVFTAINSVRFRPGVQALFWVALVAIGVCGRLWQPAYNVTPLAAISLLAGSLFAGTARGTLLAAATPLAAVLLSNLVLPAYGSPVMAIVIYAALAWPVVLGGLIRRQGWLAVCGGSLAASLVFYLTTNFAHWALSHDYPHTLAGLGACYVAALPFYRWMPVGDLAWSLTLFAGLAAVVKVDWLLLSGRAAPVASHGSDADRLTDDRSDRQ